MATLLPDTLGILRWHTEVVAAPLLLFFNVAAGGWVNIAALPFLRRTRATRVTVILKIAVIAA